MLESQNNKQNALRVPITDAGGYYTGTEVETALQEIGAAGATTIPYQELVTTQSVVNADVVLTDTLNNTPIFSAACLILFLNGVALAQGAGNDYLINTTTGQVTWLASTGTAPNLKTTHKLLAKYES